MDTLTALSANIAFNSTTGMYEINTDIIILENDTLKLLPGEVLNFLDFFYIRIYGNLNAVGTANQKIKLGNPNFTIGNGNYWSGIQFFDTSPDGESILKYCEVRGAISYYEYLTCCYEPAILCKNSSPIIDHCVISQMDSSCDSGGGVGIVCEGESNPLISFNTFRDLFTSIAIICLPDLADNINSYPSPLIYGCSIMSSVTGFFELPADYNYVVMQGGFLDNCYLGATSLLSDTTFGYPVDTIGDGFCTTTSTFDIRPRFYLVDGVVNPRSDTLITGINETEVNVLPTTTQILVLKNNYPNPFSGFTTISFEVAKHVANISLAIYDSKGNLVREIIKDKNYNQGSYKVDWHGENESNDKVKEGIYFYKLTSGGQMMVKKAIVVR
jgi:hypothetical protein